MAIFDLLRNSIESGTPLHHDQFGSPTAFDLQAATTVLLVHLCASDSAIGVLEITTLQGSLRRQFGLDEIAAAHLVEVATFLDKTSDNLEAFSRLLKSSFTPGQRVTILAMVWKVLMADGVISSFEALTAQELTQILDLSEAHLADAKMLYESGKV